MECFQLGFVAHCQSTEYLALCKPEWTLTSKFRGYIEVEKLKNLFKSLFFNDIDYLSDDSESDSNSEFEESGRPL